MNEPSISNPVSPAEVHRLLLHKLISYLAVSTTLRVEVQMPAARVNCRIMLSKPRLMDRATSLYLRDLTLLDTEDTVNQLCFLKYVRQESKPISVVNRLMGNLQNRVNRTRFILKQQLSKGNLLYVYSGGSSYTYKKTTLEFKALLEPDHARPAFNRAAELLSKRSRNAIVHAAAVWEKYPSDKNCIRFWRTLMYKAPLELYLWDWGSVSVRRRAA